MARQFEGSRLMREFNVGRLLGVGGFGAVLEVQRRSDMNKFAVKLTAGGDPKAALEVQNFGRLPAHSNVVIYATAWEDVIPKNELDILKRSFNFPDALMRIPQGMPQMRFLCIQMELCGQDLRHWLRNQSSVNRHESQNIFLQLLTGLQHIHTHKLIHRDLKPENVFFALNDGRRVKIGDFGIAARHVATVGVQHTSKFGTPLYMAPEQQTSHYGRKADLYALGLILFELFYPPAQRALGQSISNLRQTKALPGEFHQWPVVQRAIVGLLDFEPTRRPTTVQLIAEISGQGVAPPNHVAAAHVHRNVRCDYCGARDFPGVRYKCSVCPNFDLCERCICKPGPHPAFHSMINIPAPHHHHHHHHQQQHHHHHHHHA